ncbi:MAG: glycosyltransferase, partial [Actinomycetota bacterium]|nr:glycosyltransferase [Actinomycetota bacterium]
KWSRLAGTRVLLNVHRSDEPYFEWPRALDAMANGCVLVSEPSVDTGPLVPGTHLFVAPLDCLADYARGVLANEALRSAVAHQAHDLLTGRLRMSEQLAPLIDELDGLAPKLPSRTPTATSVGGEGCRREAFPGPPLRPEPPALAPLADLAHRSAITSGFWVKQILLSERRLQRRLDNLEAHLRPGGLDHDVSVTPAWKDFRPEVSVIVTSFNQAEVIGETIDSVLASRGPPTELIVVDDHSSDGSVKAVRSHLGGVPWMPAALVAKAVNEGPSAARNAGFDMARGDKVLLVDGDDVVLPAGLAALSSALDGSDAAFTWGMLATFGVRTGVHNYLAWDLPRLLEANYIPAFAMIRSSAWRAVGGFDSDIEARFGGWEDYEFWLRLASAGFVGELVPCFVGRYRTMPPYAWSRTEQFSLDLSLPRSWLRERFPALPWPPAEPGSTAGAAGVAGAGGADGTALGGGGDEVVLPELIALRRESEQRRNVAIQMLRELRDSARQLIDASGEDNERYPF